MMSLLLRMFEKCRRTTDAFRSNPNAGSRIGQSLQKDRIDRMDLIWIRTRFEHDDGLDGTSIVMIIQQELVLFIYDIRTDM